MLVLAALLRALLAARLHDAAAENDMVSIRKWVAAGDDIDESSGGDSPLIVAIRDMKDRAVHFLLFKGADPLQQDSQGFSPLHIAAAVGNAFAAQRLLAAGAWTSQLHKDGYTPIHRAAMGSDAGHTETIRVLVSAGVDPDEPSQVPYDVSRRHLQPLDLATRAESRLLLQTFLNETWRRPTPFWSWRTREPSGLDEPGSGLEAGSGVGSPGSDEGSGEDIGSGALSDGSGEEL